MLRTAFPWPSSSFQPGLTPSESGAGRTLCPGSEEASQPMRQPGVAMATRKPEGEMQHFLHMQVDAG